MELNYINKRIYGIFFIIKLVGNISNKIEEEDIIKRFSSVKGLRFSDCEIVKNSYNMRKGYVY